MKILKKFLLYWLPVLVWASVIYSFSARHAIQTFEIHWKDFIVKKCAHMTEYAIFAVLLYRAFVNSGVSKKTALISIVVIGFLYGLSDEFHQEFTPGREPTLRDVGFDTIGAGLGSLFIWKLLPKMPKKLKILAKKLDLL